MVITCPSCASENPEGKRFCGDCGQALAQTCTACGAVVDPGRRFCGDCGAAVDAGTPAVTPPAARAEPVRPVAERRLTTVLFADLVGFTALSETRDAEDVRELLSAYFAMAKTVVTRYGGTVEKFIGDAVMAVWGVPVAHEDDAERAVRAGLDLVSGIAAVAGTAGVPGLTMRVGILTGEVAVTLGAVGEGMVAGDAVNTAARIQSAAAPGEVWVDETTRSMTSAAVTYDDAGDHLLKGKAEPVRLHKAGAVVANVGGAQRVDGLEAPFVGRDHELRLVKELFHGVGEGPRLVAVFGLAGVGKTRLAWEYEKYIDGIADVVRWHRGRALSYGDGVSFWAVAEMVRARLGVVDGDGPAVVDEKLDALLGTIVPDRQERDWLRPRMAALLGREAGGFGRDDLFSAWSTFFERVGGGETVVLVLDDMQHADADLLDFLDHLLDVARYPLFVLTLARSELLDVRPGWGSGRRATSVHLEPLGEPAMSELVDGLVDGLPDSARRALVDRSEGIPVYALEMVRALIDRDAVIPQGGRYVVAPDAAELVDLAALDAPPSLQALIGARLDALTAEERRLVQEAAAHGLAFSHDGIAATTTVADLDAVLAGLVRKEIFELHTDRFSAEHGQYRFVQALVRTVAYDTLSRRDRKARHLAVAEYLEQSQSDEYAAVIARHYLDAVESGPDDPDAAELVVLALGKLERAAERAEALGSPDEALRLYTTALACPLVPLDRARLLEGAARTAKFTNRYDLARTHAEQARDLYEAVDSVLDAGRVIALLGELHSDRFELQAALALLEPALERAEAIDPEGDTVFRLLFILGRVYAYAGDARNVMCNRRAMVMAEARQDWESVTGLLGRMAVEWSNMGCPTMAMSQFRAAIELGRRHHQPRPTILALMNISTQLKNHDLEGALVNAREALETSLQVGARDILPMVAVNLGLTLWLSGDWDELEALYDEHGEDLDTHPVEAHLFRATLWLVHGARGRNVDAQPAEGLEKGQDGGVAALIAGLVAQHAGDLLLASRELSGSVEELIGMSGLDDDFAIVWPLAVEAAVAAGELDEAERLITHVESAPAALVTRLAAGHLPRLRALVGMARGADDDEIDADLERAAAALRDFGARFYLGRALLELGQRRVARGDEEGAAAALDEAQSVLTELSAERWIDETRRAGSLSGR